MKIGIVEKLLINACEKRSVTKKQLVSSYVSLFLAFTLIVTTTVAWFTSKDTATLSSSSITMNGTAGLRVNNGEDLTGTIALPKNVKLSEASSIDGRNMFFPTTGSFEDNTADMLFREGNVSDKNTSYYYKTFELSSDSGNTDVFIKDYHVQIGDVIYSTSLQGSSDKIAPLRIALITDSAKAPIVIDPSAGLKNYVNKYRAVASADDQGVPVTAESNSTSFADYFYATANPIFSLDENERLDVTVVIWLEGGDRITDNGDQKNNLNEYIGKNVSLEINFETNWEHMDIVRFVDNTVGDTDTSVRHWVDTDGCLVTLTYKDLKTQEQKTVNMVKSSNYEQDHTWTAALPQNVITDIRFNRYNPKAKEVWNAWYTQSNVNSIYPDQNHRNLQTSRIKEENEVKYRCLTYEAQGGNGHATSVAYRPYPCKGYWIVDRYSVEIEEIETPTTPTSPTNPPTDPPTKPPTDPPATSASVKVSCTDNGKWAKGKLYLVIENNGVEREVEIDSSSEAYYQSDGVEVHTGDKIVKLKNAKGNTITVSYTITSSNVGNNITIEIFNDGSGANIRS